MKLLFLSYHFLGPLIPLAVWLAERGHEILYASNRTSTQQRPFFDGIKRVILKRFSAPVKKESRLDILENALRAARYAENSFQAIKDSGFVPDLVFSASSGGAALAIPSVFPAAYWLNFLEAPRGEYASISELQVQDMQIGLANASLIFYPSQKLSFPAIFRPGLRIFRPVVNSFWLAPAESPREERLAVFFNLLEPQKIINAYLQASPQNRAIWIVDNAYARKSFMANFNSEADQRCLLCDSADLEATRNIFRKAQLTYFEFPGVMAYRAMACGCPSFAAPNIRQEDLPKGMLQAPGDGKSLSALLDDAMLLKYGRKCHSIIAAHYAAQVRLPAWFEKISQEAAMAKTCAKNPD